MTSDKEHLDVEATREQGQEAAGTPTTAAHGGPLDPTQLRVDTRMLTIDHLAARMAEGGLDLAPAIRRHVIWNPIAQSRLIESLLLRVPLPAFYFDAGREERWLVLDGLHRLTALDSFINAKQLVLRGLDFHDHLEGLTFDALPRHFQRRILETQVTVHMIQDGTPPDIRYALFQRINTVAAPLAAAEMRYLLHHGPATELLDRLTSSQIFREVTGGDLDSGLLADRDCVLRFLAFHLSSYTGYQAAGFDRFLSETMATLNTLGDEPIQEIETAFMRAMQAAKEIFGEDAFRVRLVPEGPPAPVNTALFETWTVNLAALDDARLAVALERRERLREAFIFVMHNDEAFVEAIAANATDSEYVIKRFSVIETLMQGVLQ